MDTRLFCQFVIMLVVTSLRVVRPQCELTCTPVTAQSQVWVSNLMLLDATQDSLMVQWDPDTGRAGYFVQFRVEGAPSFTTATVEFLNSSVTSFNIEGLSSSTMYDIRVCREVALPGNDDNCGTCVLCAMTRQPEVPPSAPLTLTTTTTPETISLDWEIPSEVNDERGIANYSVACVSEGLNRTAVVFRTFVRFSGLAPNTRFDCSVVAFNRFGASSAAIAEVMTSNRTSDPGALFIFLKPRLVYRTITTTLITSNDNARASVDDSPLLIQYEGDLQDMDYDYRKNLLYFSAVETNGMNVVKVTQIQSNLMNDGTFAITAEGSLENLHELSAGVAISRISVDWVNSELYYVESSLSSSRIMRLILNDTGMNVLSQSCVVELANTVITNIKVDAVHGFFYYGTDTMLFRTELSRVQLSSMSCQSSISATVLRTFTALFDFTIQQNEAIYILGRQETICNENQWGLTLSINLEEQSTETFAYGSSPAFDPNTAFDSFTQFMVTASSSTSGSTIAFVPTDELVAGCGNPRNVQLRTASTNVSLIQVFRESQQPVPMPLNPPSSIKVSTEGNTTAVIWAAPLFPGDIYSADAFDGWTYSVRYCTVNTTQTCLEETTTELSIQLSVSFDTSYVVSVRAVGPGGASTVSSEVFFTTEPAGVDTRLVIAHEGGILRSSLASQPVEMLAEATPVSVAVDAYDDVIYWASEGSSATIYSRRGSIMRSLYSRRDQPFGLEYDWVGNKLLWVEDGENPQAPLRSFIGQVLPTGESMFGETAGAVGTVMDSYNGLFFWTNRSTIHMRTLSGIPLEPCFSPSGGASSLAVDATRRNLYWLSNSATASQRWKISQLDYSGTKCNPASLVEQDLTGLSLSSSSTVMVYASNKLYFTSRLSNKIYTVSSRLGDVGPDQSLAMGEVKLTGVNIAGTLEIRDMAVQSTEAQPLPGLLASQNRGVSGLAPSIPSVGPSLNVMNSTESSVLVEWEGSMVSGVSDAVIYYEVSYSLSAGSSVMNSSTTVRSTFITIPVPQPSTDVTVSVVPISVWARSTRAGVGSFTSLPSIPGQVMNVRVFLYTPLIDQRGVRTAMVTWDSVAGDLSQYVVRVLDYTSGMDLDLHQVLLDVRLSYSVLTADSLFVPPRFPLVVGNMYGVEVSASNAGGTGLTSERINFTVSETGMSYPMQVLSLESSGMQYYGLETAINQALNVETNAGPIVVDAVDRRVYWYERNLNLIFSQLLGIGGARESFLMISADRTVVSMAYDWIAKTLYVSRVVTATGQLDLLRVEIYDPDAQEVVFPMLQLPLVNPTAVINSEMNPVTGFFFWSITMDGATNVYSLNLRDSTISTVTPVVRSRNRRRRRKRNVMMDLTPALALNPLNNNLLVSDRASGNILQCLQAFDTCSLYVNRTVLQTNSGRMDVGLPAGSIKYGGQLIYWTSENSSSVPGIFAVDVSDLTTLIVVNDQATSNFIVPLNPDQQPLPPLMCLSPDPGIPLNRQISQLASATSTTLTIVWTDRESMIMNCGPDVFSLAPFVFTIFYERSNDARVERMTRRRSIVLSNLIPFTEYIVGIQALNPYSAARGATGLFDPRSYKTTEGVPDPPTFELFNVTGTTTAGIQWFHVPGSALRGSTSARSYIVSVGNVNLTTTSNSIIVSGPKAALLNVKLYSFNNVSVSSTGVDITIQLWSVVQQPAPIMRENDTIVVNVTISDTFIGEIERVGITACELSVATVVGSVCKCPYSNNTGDHQLDSFQTVSMVRPVTLSFMVVNLTVFTEYCVLPIGYYSTEIAGGEGIVISTASGVPNAPMLNLTKKFVLTWDHPSSNGNDITSYTVIFRPAVRQDVGMSMDRLNFADTTYNLVTDAPVMRGVDYRVVLVATNDNGNSEESNEQSFELPTEIPVAVVAASAAVGGTVLLSICIILVLICCFLKARNTKRELRLSYMYGPDHELSNLRNAISRSNGQNPHYTWSFDDYQYSDDHLNLLTKFPRNNLKLETFIDRGEFGEVFQGTATDILGTGTGPTPVAVKTLRKGATTEEQRKFLAEASLMGNFNHPNILKVLGVCVDNDPVYIILELMPGGDLLKFLRKAKMDHGPTLLTLPEQIQVALDVAHGCYYLEQQHFIHRDIAARNCLVSSKGADRVVKIGDFGLAKDLYSSDYYQVEGQRKLPVRWMAPEALLQGKFTVESDIWSYGVLLWEIMTLGNQPYPGRINQEVLQFVTGGGRLDRPDKCPSKIYQLMQSCWRRYASDRPHFEHIVNTLTAFLERLKRPDSIYNSDSDSDDEESNHMRQGSNKLPARTPSIRSTGRGIMNLARSGSMKLRNSFRRHNSTQKREEHMTNSQQDDFRERGPF